MNTLPQEIQRLIVEMTVDECHRCARDLAAVCKLWNALFGDCVHAARPLNICERAMLQGEDVFFRWLDHDHSGYREFELNVSKRFLERHASTTMTDVFSLHELYPLFRWAQMKARHFKRTGDRYVVNPSSAKLIEKENQLRSGTGIRPRNHSNSGGAALWVGQNNPERLHIALVRDSQDFLPANIMSYDRKLEVIRVLIEHNRLSSITIIDGCPGLKTLRVMVEEGGFQVTQRIVQFVSTVTDKRFEYLIEGPRALKRIHKKGIAATRKPWVSIRTEESR